MHGTNTLKYLNDKAVAEAILAKHKTDQVDPTFQKAVEDSLAAKAMSK